MSRNSSGILSKMWSRLWPKGGNEINAASGSASEIYSTWTKEQLINKIQELESTQCSSEKQKIKPLLKRKDVDDTNNNDTNTLQKKKKIKTFNFYKYNTRFIALRFAYLGWNYNGLAVQKDPTPLPTVEGVILESLFKCKLVPSLDIQEYSFSRCGRTDKGVSAMNQVISLKIRSNLTPEQQLDPNYDDKEIDYVLVLNQNLPPDIRVSAVCLRPPNGFNARHSCIHRHYKYLFKQGDGDIDSYLDLERMEKACKYLEGEHDFRNFCKIDGSKQITNFKRYIRQCKIIKVGDSSDDMYCLDLIGSAFLWHQVRCMMGTLFLIGQRLEEPELILDMFDINKTPQKPLYDMASDLPLILYDCKFPEMEWIVKNFKPYKRVNNVRATVLNYELKSTITKLFQQVLPSTDAFNRKERVCINLGDGVGKVVRKYEKVKDRKVMQSVEAINAKYRANRRMK